MLKMSMHWALRASLRTLIQPRKAKRRRRSWLSHTHTEAHCRPPSVHRCSSWRQAFETSSEPVSQAQPTPAEPPGPSLLGDGTPRWIANRPRPRAQAVSVCVYQKPPHSGFFSNPTLDRLLHSHPTRIRFVPVGTCTERRSMPLCSVLRRRLAGPDHSLRRLLQTRSSKQTTIVNVTVYHGDLPLGLWSRDPATQTQYIHM
ncbi:hypothetical protein QBC37DRAFT_27948 [Rhypophila decipiens]|uniref:Uncharacterized protein n=1 Tax=Rhypophila decipiens TaxID=261697 RepID=A0AAN7B2W8_9PEZI|nr:hypothetical protein QBC37DRAFT_27948 [Rhypophila decipiens]